MTYRKSTAINFECKKMFHAYIIGLISLDGLIKFVLPYIRTKLAFRVFSREYDARKKRMALRSDRCVILS